MDLEDDFKRIDNSRDELIVLEIFTLLTSTNFSILPKISIDF